MPRDIVSEQQCNIEFVKAVGKHPCLYNFSLPAYSRKDVSDQAWEEVAEASNMTPSACRERWRNLRAVFMRTIKKTVAGTKKKPYYLADVMQFVVPFLQPTNMTEAEKQKMLEAAQSKETGRPSLEIKLEEVKIESMDDEDTDTSQSGHEWSMETINTSLKRSREVEEHCPNPSKRPPLPIQPSSSIATPETSDPVTSFINSLMPELREMNSAQFKCFKRRVLILIDDITTEIPSRSHNDNEYIM